MFKKIGTALLLTALTAGCSAIYGDHPTAASSTNAEQLTVSKDTVRQMQSALQAKGFYNGPIDGIVGPGMRTAIANYQQSQGMTKTATLDATTIRALTGDQTAAASPLPAGSSGSSVGPKLSADQIRQSVASQGYSNVAGVRSWGPNNYSAQAVKDGRTLTLGVDGHTGQVLTAP